MKLEKLNREEAFRYMGSKGREIPPNLIPLSEECEQALLKAISPKYCWKLFDIEKTDEGISVQNTLLTLKGSDIENHLENCEKAVLLCATLSSAADNVIRTFEAAAMEKAVIADSLASAAIEQVCDLAEEEIRQRLPEYNFTWRFSPGYGDFPLEIQGDFLKTLDAPKIIGVNITKSLMLTPTKSVTAVMGLSKNEISKGRRGCGCCNMKDKCEFRKRGTHCGF